MATVNLNSAFFANMQDSSGNAPAVATGSLIQLFSRNTPPPALPTLSNSTTNECFFHDTQDSTTGLFTTDIGTPSFGSRGLRLTSTDSVSTAATSSNTAGKGTWWSEGIVAVDGPLNPLSQIIFDKHPSLGTFQIASVDNVWRFQVDNDGTNTHTFSSISVPITQTGVGSTPAPFYFRLLREIPSTGTGSLYLVINDGTTTQTQTITGVSKPVTATATPHSFGQGTAGTLNVYWWRGIGTDDGFTGTSLSSNYWSAPTVFQNVSYFSDADSTADSGTNDQYWHDFNLIQPSFENALIMNGAGRIKARVAATNTAPTGTTSSLFSGSYFTVQNINEVLADPQGRYLALEWRFEPGDQWPLASGGASIRSDSIDLVSLEYFATAQGSNIVDLAVSGEGDSGGTLPFSVESPIDTTLLPRVSRMNAEFPYTVARPLGTAIRRSYRVTWRLTESERDTLIAFFSSRDGGEQAFTWTPPGDSTTSKAALSSDLEIRKLAPNAYEILATMIEVF